MMKRREWLLLAAGSATASAVAATPDEHGSDHHHHMSGSPLVDSALGCVKTGELCQAHCFTLFGEGDTSVAACARSVNALTAVCGALAVLAAQQSPLLPRYAGVAKDFCNGCEEECRKHAEKHAPCKACAEACATCARECAKIAA
jgi:Cys-rich four helix bundle protein (predicted Tat secretion target)